MGFKEELISNWEDKTIEYRKKHFYIIKQFDYEGKEYLYGVNVETYDKNPMEVVFLYRVKELTMHVISFKEIDSEKVLNRIKKKIANNDEADDDDIVDVVLLPFMGSKRSLTELVEISVNLVNELIVDKYLRKN